MKQVHVLTLGGTIAYSCRNGAPQVGDLTEYLESLDDLKQDIQIQTTAFRRKSSSSMLIDDLIQLAQKVQSLLDEGTDGVVVVQGTDTIEETAFALELMLHSEKPVVVTGAMRNPDMRGADGPANLVASIRTAASDACRGLGAMVVFNDAIYPSLYVRKIHPQSTEAFASEFGPLGYLAEGRPSLRMRPIRRPIPWVQLQNASYSRTACSVPIYSVPIGDDGKLLEKALACGCEGVVLEAMGGGHTPSELADILQGLAAQIPVVLASRIGQGDMLTSTYAGYPGSETSLLSRGLIGAGILDGRKARILLILQLLLGCSTNQIQESYRIFSSEA